MTKDQDRVRQSTEAYHTLGRSAPVIADRLHLAHSEATPQAPRRPGAQPGSSSDGPSDPVYVQVAQLEQHLRTRGGPLHRTALLLTNLDDLAQAIDADHRLPTDDNGVYFADKVATIRPTIRRGPVGARLHTLRALADDIGQELTLLNEAIFDQWRQMWRSGEDRYGNVLDQALLTYSSAASYAHSIARSLAPFAPVRDDRPRCGDCGFRLVKYKRLQQCGACYERENRPGRTG